MGNRAEDMKHQAKSMASDAAREARHQASDLAEQARHAAQDGVSRVRHEAERRAQEGVDYGASEVSNTASALRRASEEVDGTVQAQLLRYAADGLTEISESLRGKSVGDMAADLANFGRRNPVAFLGGAALAGFAIARFARASRPHHYEGGRDGGYDPGNYRAPVYGRGGMNQPAQPATTHTPTGAAGPVRPTGSTPPAGTAPGTAGRTTSTTPSTTPGSAAGSAGGGAGTSRGPGATPAAGGSKPTTTGPSSTGPSGSNTNEKGKPNV